MKPVALLIACVVPVFAHHSNAPYDMTRPFTVSGTVTKFFWANPHSYIELDSATDNGVEHWRLEIEAVNLLRRYGWTKDSLKAGEKISCTGARAKDPAVFAQKCFTVEFPDGRKLTATPIGEPPEPSAPRRSDH
ncbi:MAG: hypothetical protein LAP61_02645 [Acidobacteriia bacterium]|nr:hypothetical protein [Terriglobia bacterium]